MATPRCGRVTRFLWLELTGRCQLSCLHCYADSSPRGEHGVLTHTDWIRVLDEAVAHGVRVVQFIGGEPTLHPAFIALARHALAIGLRVEVFTNLLRVGPDLWSLYRNPGLSLATSYYSASPSVHDTVTGRLGSQRATRRNIAKAIEFRIPIRAAVIGVLDRQGLSQAKAELTALGVQEIRVSRLRQIGRGGRATSPELAELCGACGQGVAAVSADGAVWPCVFARSCPVGDVRRDPLHAILSGLAMPAIVEQVSLARESERSEADPKECPPYRGKAG